MEKKEGRKDGNNREEGYMIYNGEEGREEGWW